MQDALITSLIHALVQVETRVLDVNVIYLAVVGEQDDVRVQGFGFRVSGFGFRVQGSGFRVQGLGFAWCRDVEAAFALCLGSRV